MPDVQQTLLFVKPDGVRRKLVGEVIRRIEAKGFDIRQMRLLTADEDLAGRLYAEHVDKPFFGELISFVTSGPIVAMVVEGRDAVEGVRQIMGATDPLDAVPGSIRGDFATVITQNVVHGSDSAENAAREISYFFAETSLCPRTR